MSRNRRGRKKNEPPLSLPEPYEQYLQQQADRLKRGGLYAIRLVLTDFHLYLLTHKLTLTDLRITQVDTFLAAYHTGYAPETQRHQRGIMRRFLRFLFLQQVLTQDLSALLESRVQYTYRKPPKFLTPNEIAQLFASCAGYPARNLMLCHALLHLAYTLGLRPMEISAITFDDIAFQRKELTVTARKAYNPIKMPLSDSAIKAMAAYIVGARPKSRQRHLFLTLEPPYRPLSPQSVGYHLTASMRRAGVRGTAYWLRHTYAQQLLQQGESIFVIKEMLGHTSLLSTKRYLSINTELMRKELFNEDL